MTGTGVETPSAFASLASLSGGSGERGGAQEGERAAGRASVSSCDEAAMVVVEDVVCVLGRMADGDYCQSICLKLQIKRARRVLEQLVSRWGVVLRCLTHKEVMSGEGRKTGWPRRGRGRDGALGTEGRCGKGMRAG